MSERLTPAKARELIQIHGPLSNAEVTGELIVDRSWSTFSLTGASVNGNLTLVGLDDVDVDLSGTVIRGRLTVRDCSGARFEAKDAVVERITLFDRAWYARTCLIDTNFRRLVELKVGGDLDLTAVLAEGPARIQWAQPSPQENVTVAFPDEPELNLKDSWLVAGGQIRWGAGSIDLHRARFGRATSIDSVPEASGPPALKSVARADMEDVALHDVDLSRTHFSYAYNLSELAAFDPDKLARRDGRPAIADDLVMRRESAPASREDEVAPRPTERSLEEVYRGLRMSLERHGAALAANELLFAERYWRRKRSTGAQWALLRAYELVSGYGVRPMRALAALLVTLLLATAAFAAFGGLRKRVEVALPVAAAVPIPRLQPPPERDPNVLCDQQPAVVDVERSATIACETDLVDDLAFAARSATTLLRPTNEYVVTGPAIWIDIALRLLSPALFALFVLALRSRVVR